MSLKRVFAQVTFQKAEVTAVVQWIEARKHVHARYLVEQQRDNRQNQNLQFESATTGVNNVGQRVRLVSDVKYTLHHA